MHSLLSSLARTIRGYRKASHGFRVAVVEASSQPHMRNIATVLASARIMTGQGPVSEKDVRNSAKNPSQYTTAERWSYMQEAQQAFKDSTIVGLVCDAVHVGDSDWLNCILWQAHKGVGYVCPPQAWDHLRPNFNEMPCAYRQFLANDRVAEGKPAGDRFFSITSFSSGIPASAASSFVSSLRFPAISPLPVGPPTYPLPCSCKHI